MDVRDNARDFGLTKDAGIAALFFLPERGIAFQLAGSLERNDARIFRSSQAALRTSSLLRVPQGLTFVVSELFGATWERRDNPLDATAGTYVSASVEHVRARPLGGERPRGSGTCDPGQSWFLRYNNRVAGYVRLSKRGLALATSFRWGMNHQLCKDSRTYPDRLFFMGGVDSLRGFLQDSLVPEDVAREVVSGRPIPASALGPTSAGVFASPAQRLRVSEVVIRGGDLFINPRLELRIPLTESVQTALFVDAGNLWADSGAFLDAFALRYSTGSGVRIGTPIGPLVFDYGFNVERVLDLLRSSDETERYWEDIGAFHFSIGLF